MYLSCRYRGGASRLPYNYVISTYSSSRSSSSSSSCSSSSSSRSMDLWIHHFYYEHIFKWIFRSITEIKIHFDKMEIIFSQILMLLNFRINFLFLNILANLVIVGFSTNHDLVLGAMLGTYWEAICDFSDLLWALGTSMVYLGTFPLFSRSYHPFCLWRGPEPSGDPKMLKQ